MLCVGFGPGILGGENNTSAFECFEGRTKSLHPFCFGFEIERRAQHGAGYGAADKRREPVRRSTKRDEFVFVSFDAMLL